MSGRTGLQKILSNSQLAAQRFRSPKTQNSLCSSTPRNPFTSRSYTSSTSPPTPKPSRRLTKLGIALAGAGGVFAWDRYQNASTIERTLRTAVYGIIIAADFKLNFNPENSESIDALHQRVAKRIHHVCVTNGGLYIKLAQSVAIQAAILPKPYREAFATVFDAAPGVSWEEAVKVFEGEFGVHPDEAFEDFSREPIASASIAQVHKARLKRKEGVPAWKEGEGWVAVKIRKPSVPKQIEWDLFAYKTLLYTNEWLFDLPVAFVADYVCEHMRKEVDLHNEAENSARTAAFVAEDPSLRDRVLIPEIFWKWTGKAVMTAEFVEACRLTDTDRLDKYQLSRKDVMDTATALLAAQIFKWGFSHCDPHPGNVLVRPNPKHPKNAQIVLIDHGLYITLSEKFRMDYCTLWRSMMVLDIPTIERIAQSWGIAKENSEMFASMTLLRPQRLKKRYETLKETREQSTYEAQTGLKDRLRAMLENEQLIPRELIFITRSMRMMQANNQALGSPSNRINALAHWALAGLEMNPSSFARSFRHLGLRNYAVDRAQSILFRFTLLVIDVGFMLTQVRQWVFSLAGTKTGEGFEDVLQRQVTELARKEFGVELDDAAFTG